MDKGLISVALQHATNDQLWNELKRRGEVQRRKNQKQQRERDKRRHINAVILKGIRAHFGYSQRALGAALGVTQVSVLHVEKGRRIGDQHVRWAEQRWPELVAKIRRETQ